MAKRDVEAFRRLIDAANREDIEGALALIAEDVVWIAARSAVQGPYRGHDGIRAFFADNQENFERFEPAIDEIRDLGGRLLVIGAIRVQGRGSGVVAEVPMAGIATYRDGKLVRWEDFRERDRALEAAGLSRGPVAAENVELVLESVRRFRPGGLDAWAELWHPETRMTVPDGWPEPGPFIGLEATRKQFERLLESFSGFDVENVEIVAATEDRVVAKFHIPVRGTESGLSSDLDAAIAYRIEAGLLSECLIHWGVDEALEAAGLTAPES